PEAAGVAKLVRRAWLKTRCPLGGMRVRVPPPAWLGCALCGRLVRNPDARPAPPPPHRFPFAAGSPTGRGLTRGLSASEVLPAGSSGSFVRGPGVPQQDGALMRLGV